ncbi:MAG: outer membrane protein assembly factor BamD [Rhodothalassiaceae bacterium]|nr:MAG: outer membrane protein assembly factor BamD [Rhodothalassiaceae bacterium]
MPTGNEVKPMMRALSLPRISSFGMLRLAVSILVPLAFLVLPGCSSSKKDTYIARDVNVLYNLGYENLLRKRWQVAAAAFDEVERQHPYSSWARRAQLMSAYAHYMNRKYDDAILAAERFLSLHPGSKLASYAHYLIAVSYFEQMTDVYRDQTVTLKARDALREVIKRYPETDYATDAKLKLALVEDQLAAHDMMVGRFYLKQGHYLAAILRFRHVLQEYQTSTQTPEALHRLVEAYSALGIEDEARRYAAVLGANFPGSRWYRYSYALLEKKTLKEDRKRGFFAWLF